MKTILQTALLLSAAYVLSACGGSGNNNSNGFQGCQTVNGVYTCNQSSTGNTTGTVSCVQQTQCWAGTAYSCDFNQCLPLSLCVGANLQAGANPAWTYGYYQATNRCWPVKTY